MIHKRCVNNLFGYCKLKSPPMAEDMKWDDCLECWIGGQCKNIPATCKYYLTFTQEAPPPVKKGKEKK